jgi:hypothetical protein
LPDAAGYGEDVVVVVVDDDARVVVVDRDVPTVPVPGV